MKVALGIEYNGKQYCGWQRQEKVRSVQEELEKALSFVANEKIEVFCAGRTDSGQSATNIKIWFQKEKVCNKMLFLCNFVNNFKFQMSVR